MDRYIYNPTTTVILLHRCGHLNLADVDNQEYKKLQVNAVEDKPEQYHDVNWCPRCDKRLSKLPDIIAWVSIDNVGTLVTITHRVYTPTHEEGDVIFNDAHYAVETVHSDNEHTNAHKYWYSRGKTHQGV